MRIYRRDDLDDEEAPPAEPRLERLRELVDELPPLERHCVERILFGSATKLQAGREAGVSPKAVREALNRGIARLRAAMLTEDAMGEVRAAFGPRFDALSLAPDVGDQGPQA